MCNLKRRAPQNLEKVLKNPVEKIASNPVTSVAVVVFSALTRRAFSRLFCHFGPGGSCNGCRATSLGVQGWDASEAMEATPMIGGGLARQNTPMPTKGQLASMRAALFCRAKGTAQSLKRGRSGMDLPPKFGKEIPSRTLRKKKVSSRWSPF